MEESREKNYEMQESHRGKWDTLKTVRITPEQAETLNKDTKSTNIKYVEVKGTPKAKKEEPKKK